MTQPITTRGGWKARLGQIADAYPQAAGLLRRGTLARDLWSLSPHSPTFCRDVLVLLQPALGVPPQKAQPWLLALYQHLADQRFPDEARGHPRRPFSPEEALYLALLDLALQHRPDPFDPLMDLLPLPPESLDHSPTAADYQRFLQAAQEEHILALFTLGRELMPFDPAAHTIGVHNVALHTAILARTMGIPAIVGVGDALSAKIANVTDGIDGVLSSGFTLAAQAMGLPDAELYTRSDNVYAVSNMCYVLDKPLIADIDTAYGNAVTTIKTVNDFERAGASGMVIEDQISPKRCPICVTDLNTTISAEEAAGKIRAAVENKLYPETVIIARTVVADGGALRNVWDVLRGRMSAPGAVVLAGQTEDGKPLLLAAATDEAVAKGFDAGALIKAMGPAIKGGGGGKPSMAQAGGKDVSGIDAALESARKMLL